MKQTIRKICLFIFCTGCACISYAQNETVSELSRPYAAGQWHVRLKKAEGINKPEYLFSPDYLIANFYAPDSKEVVKDKMFRLNLQYNKLFFRDNNNEEMEVISPVKRIEFIKQEGNNTAVLFERGFAPVDKLTADNFYQVLVSGKASLLLDTKFEETKDFAYGGTPEISINKVKNYYGATGNSIVKLAKPENIIQLFADKSKEVSDYIKQEKIKVKNQEDLEKVFTFYNTLFK